MSQSFTKVFSKMLTVIFVLSLVATSLPVNAAESKNSIDDLKKIQNNVREKDPSKIQSEKLTQKTKDVLVSNQKDLDIEIDSNTKQIRVNHKSKGNTIIGIPNGNQLTDVQTIDNQVVFSNKDVRFDVVVEAVAGGMRQVINIKDSSAPTVYDFPVSLESGEKLIINEDGSAKITKPLTLEQKKQNKELAKTPPKNLVIPDYSVKVLIAKPWAKDANGKELKTNYSINGTNLRQSIETKDAIFPIVADPLWCGNQIGSTNWFYNTGAQTATYPNEIGWTLSVYPNWCGLWGASYDWFSNYLGAWYDLCSASGTGGWCDYWTNDEHSSMFYQFVCHFNIIGANKKLIDGSSETVWNLDEWRPNVGWTSTLLAGCNPKKL